VCDEVLTYRLRVRVLVCVRQSLWPERARTRFAIARLFWTPPKMKVTPKLVVCVFYICCLGGGVGGGGGKVMLGC
jgi:hypothetical protein